MQRHINQRQLRNDSGAIMRDVEAGQTFVVTRNGVPAAELRPLQRRTAVHRDHAVAGARHLAPIDAERFRVDLDAALDQEVR